MRHDLPTLNDFLMVQTLAQHKSFRRAAEELNKSPSVLSRQLGTLEDKVGGRIFERSRGHFSETEFGKGFVQTARKVLNITDEYMDSFNSHVNAQHGKLSIAALPSMTGTLLPKLMTGFNRKFPNIELALHDMHTSELIDAVDNCDMDLGLTVGTDSVRKRLSFMPLIEDKFYVVSSKSDSNMTKKVYSIEELSRFPFIAGKKGTGTREFIDSILGQFDSNFTPRIEVSHASTAIALVSEGLGITILPTLMLHELATPNIKLHEISDFTKARKIGIASPIGKAYSPATNFLVKYVKSEIKPLYQSVVSL